MIIKRYLVSNMNEAVTKIRYELGKDAVIVSHRKIRKPGFIGFFSKKVIEVTAAVDNTKNNDTPAVKESIDAIKKAMKKSSIQNISSQSASDDEVIDEVKYEKSDKENKIIRPNSNSNLKEIENQSGELIKQFKEMKNMFSSMMSNNKWQNAPEKGNKLYSKLKENDVNEAIIKVIIKEVDENKENIDEFKKAHNVIKKLVNISNIENDGGIITLIGPTGVGKTTTIAKLAGKFSLIDKKKVGLITLDTYRIGAVDQLKTYAEIMCIPIKVVMSVNDIQDAVESLSECDIIIIDTTGRSSRNSAQISELKSYIDKVNTKSISLVISSTTKNADIKAIISGYKSLNYNNVIITKLDETTTYGSILNIITEAQKPLSYVTIGQSVPDDIKQLSPEEIAAMILGEDLK